MIMFRISAIEDESSSPAESFGASDEGAAMTGMGDGNGGILLVGADALVAELFLLEVCERRDGSVSGEADTGDCWLAC